MGDSLDMNAGGSLLKSDTFSSCSFISSPVVEKLNFFSNIHPKVRTRSQAPPVSKRGSTISKMYLQGGGWGGGLV